MARKVYLYIYDLSNGMARSMSFLIGKQIEGIWHTSVVIFDREYFFGGGGIESCPVGYTPAGRPLQKLLMGETNLTFEEFKNYLDQIKHKYTPNMYSLTRNNCNNFTDEVCLYLTGKPIPKNITGLPDEILSTPFGQQMLPFIQMMENNVAQNSVNIPNFDFFNSGQNPNFTNNENNQQSNYSQFRTSSEQFVSRNRTSSTSQNLSKTEAFSASFNNLNNNDNIDKIQSGQNSHKNHNQLSDKNSVKNDKNSVKNYKNEKIDKKLLNKFFTTKKLISKFEQYVDNIINCSELNWKTEEITQLKSLPQILNPNLDLNDPHRISQPLNFYKTLLSKIFTLHSIRSKFTIFTPLVSIAIVLRYFALAFPQVKFFFIQSDFLYFVCDKNEQNNDKNDRNNVKNGQNNDKNGKNNDKNDQNNDKNDQNYEKIIKKIENETILTKIWEIFANFDGTKSQKQTLKMAVLSLFNDLFNFEKILNVEKNFDIEKILKKIVFGGFPFGIFLNSAAECFSEKEKILKILAAHLVYNCAVALSILSKIDCDFVGDAEIVRVLSVIVGVFGENEDNEVEKIILNGIKIMAENNKSVLKMAEMLGINLSKRKGTQNSSIIEDIRKLSLN